MAHATLAMPHALSALRDRTAPRLRPAVTNLREFLKGILDPYRPELHYMRGPGPKWREKHGDAQPLSR